MAYVRVNENINAIFDKFVGVSSDTKPLGQKKGSTLYDMDTRKMYMSDGTGAATEWHFAFELPEEEA